MNALHALVNLTSSQFRQSTTDVFDRHCPVLISHWWIFTIFITAAYTSNLYVHLLTGENQPTIDSLEELINDADARIYLLKGTHMVDRFQYGDNTLFKGIWKKITSGQGGFVEAKNWQDIVVNSNQRN